MNPITKTAFSVFTIVAIMGVGVSSAFAASFTSAQVAQHATQADCWAILNSKVYNLTPFISQHPGGAAIIISQCGKDATATFNSGPHSATTINALNPYILGDLAVATPPVVVPPVTTPTTPTTTPATPATTTPVTKIHHESGKHRKVVKRQHSESEHHRSSTSAVTSHAGEREGNDD